jgi:hypothetical protein
MKPWLKTTFIFLIGFFLGVAATGLIFPRVFHPHHPPGAADADRILKHLSSELGLTADQKEKVSALLKQELPKADALRAEGDARFKALRESFNTQLRTILDPEQLKKHDAMLAKWAKRSKDPNCLPGMMGTPNPVSPVTEK